MVGIEKGYIVVRRVREIFFSLEPLDIYIDGHMECKIISGDVKEIQVMPGRHRVRVGRDIILYGSFNSNEVEVSVDGGGKVELECGSIYQGPRVLLSKLCLLHKDGTFYIREATV